MSDGVQSKISSHVTNYSDMTFGHVTKNFLKSEEKPDNQMPNCDVVMKEQ